MKPIIALLAGAILAGLGWPAANTLQDDSPTGAEALHPYLRELLRTATEKVAAADEFGLHARLSYDELDVAPDDSEIKVRYGGTLELRGQRPSKLSASLRSDTFAADLLCDGTTAVLFAVEDGAYGELPVDGSLSQIVDTLGDATGFTPPLADFVTEDAYERLTAGLEWGSYQGLSPVEGRVCHHLMVGREGLDWQVWIDVEEGLPRKLVMTYRDLPLSPQFEAIFTDWDLAPRLVAQDFAFDPPQNAIRVTSMSSSFTGLPEGGGK